MWPEPEREWRKSHSRSAFCNSHSPVRSCSVTSRSALRSIVFLQLPLTEPLRSIQFSASSARLSDNKVQNNNNNNNANICIARLKQNSSGALMAQTNTVLVFVQMTAVTASGVADRPQDCSKLLLQWLRSSFCRVLFLLSLFLNLFMRYPVTVTV